MLVAANQKPLNKKNLHFVNLASDRVRHKSRSCGRMKKFSLMQKSLIQLQPKADFMLQKINKLRC